MKLCPHCKEEVDMSTISASRLRNSDYRCLPCLNVWRTKHRRENRKGWRKKWRVTGDIRHKTLIRLVQSSRLRAKQKGEVHSIDLELVKKLCGDNCPILNAPYNFLGSSQNMGNSPSIDRIDPNGGYVPENIQIISHRANSMKRGASPEELLAFADWAQREYSMRIPLREKIM